MNFKIQDRVGILEPATLIPMSAQDQLEKHLSANMQAFLGFVQKRIADPELAKDILQESLLKAVKSAHTVREDEQIPAWFYRILRRSIIDAYRRRATSEEFLQKLESELETADQELEQREICKCFKALLPTLKPEYAEVIEKIDLEEKSLPETSEVLGITQNNLKVRLHRARQQLKERLVECCGRCAEHGCLDCTCDKKN
jgi:RNA polymerase sigma factor (sigma-70 family)